MSKRLIEPSLLDDLNHKLVLLGGPRQVGKTTLSKSILPKTQYYLNYDSPDDRKIILARSWPQNTSYLILDELHKHKNWKSWLKGIYDTTTTKPKILVTGSARLDTWRKGNDSLAGRHHYYRLHPFSAAELVNQLSPKEALNSLIQFGGFPEPLFAQSVVKANRWRKSHLDVILRQDMLDLEQVRNISGIETLVQLLSERVGSPISIASLGRDIQVSPHTVKNWITILEKLFVIFVVTPYSRNIARGLLKEPKIYFYDTGRVTETGGARLENVVACALLKRNHFLEDTTGETLGLHYVRDKEKREVDFLVSNKTKIEMLVEVKKSDENLSQNLRYFSERLAPAKSIQLVEQAHRRTQHGEIQIEPAAVWLSQLEG